MKLYINQIRTITAKCKKINKLIKCLFYVVSNNQVRVNQGKGLENCETDLSQLIKQVLYDFNQTLPETDLKYEGILKFPCKIVLGFVSVY